MQGRVIPWEFVSGSTSPRTISTGSWDPMERCERIDNSASRRTAAGAEDSEGSTSIGWSWSRRVGTSGCSSRRSKMQGSRSSGSTRSGCAASAKAWASWPRTTRSTRGCLALFGEKVEPEERPKKTDRERLLGDLSARRRQLIANMTAEKNRLEHASGYVAKEIKSLIRTARAPHREAREQDRPADRRGRTTAAGLRSPAVGSGRGSQGGPQPDRRSSGAREARSKANQLARRPGPLRQGQRPEAGQAFDPRRVERLRAPCSTSRRWWAPASIPS